MVLLTEFAHNIESRAHTSGTHETTQMCTQTHTHTHKHGLMHARTHTFLATRIPRQTHTPKHTDTRMMHKQRTDGEGTWAKQTTPRDTTFPIELLRDIAFARAIPLRACPSLSACLSRWGSCREWSANAHGCWVASPPKAAHCESSFMIIITPSGTSVRSRTHSPIATAVSTSISCAI